MLKFNEINFRELYACLVVGHLAVLNGIDNSFPAGIKDVMGPTLLDIKQRSLIGSINIYASAVSTLLLFAYVNRLGKKRIILLSLFFHCVAWIGIFLFPYCLEIIYICRLFSGAAGGMRNACVTYISEISHKKRRGRLLSLHALLISFGIALTYVIESLLSWQIVSITGMIVSIMGLLQMYFIPETKYWYLTKNDVEGARASILWFDPSLSAAEVDAEIDDIRTTQTRYKNKTSIFRLLIQKSILRNACLAVFMLTFRSGIGRYPMLAESRDFLDSFELQLKFETLNIIQGIIELGSSLLYLTLVDSVKRRLMLQTSCWLINVSLMILICIRYLRPAISPFDTYITMSAILVYYSIVVGFLLTATSVLVSEVASACTEARAPVVSISYCLNDFLGAVYINVFPFVLQSIGVELVMAYFIVNSCLLSLTVYFVPETIGKGLHHCVDDANEDTINNTKL